MFDIGIQELIIIFIIALLVFGPEKLPELSRKLGQFVIQVRRGVHEAKAQMENEFSEVEKKVEEDVDRLLKNVEPKDTAKEEPEVRKEDKI